MFEFSFRIRETTKRDRLLKTLLTDPSLATCDKPIPISNTCSKCSSDVLNPDIIECSKCKDKYHTLCLTHPIPSEFLTLQSTNPCLCWFCTKCVTQSESSHQSEVEEHKETQKEEVVNSQIKETVVQEKSKQVLFQLIAQHLQCDIKMIDSDASVDTIGTWTSMNHVHLIQALEGKFNVVFTEDQTVEMMDVQSIIDVLEDCGIS